MPLPHLLMPEETITSNEIILVPKISVRLMRICATAMLSPKPAKLFS